MLTKVDKSSRQRQQGSRSYGQVDNLDSYVQEDWWRKIFNANYLKTDGDVVDDQSITNTEVDIFKDILELDREDPVLDLCCGQGRHILELARRGHSQLFGLDRSHYLITRARSVNKKQKLGVTFKEGDARNIPFPADTFKAVYMAGNSFGYFESAKDDLRTLNQVKRVLRPRGKILIDMTDGDFIRQSFQPRSWEWIDEKVFVCRERSLGEEGRRLISREVITDVEKGVIADQFYAERLYNLEEIEGLLSKAGFTNIQCHGELTPDSQRNQDLGMMARRMLITASIQKEWSPVKVKKTARKLVVIMGDPSIRDEVKPNEKFDEDDFYTIDEMQKALAGLKKYNLSYLNAHDQLIKDLQSKKGRCDLVFNLCDEGYFNDPRKELHVAALLDVLDIPYTGAAPACLAYCYDKSLVRGLAIEMGIPVAKAFTITPDEVRSVQMSLDFPVIVKPNYGDSSFGITRNNVCWTVDELESALVSVRDRFGYNLPVLVEKYLTGKDLSVGIIGNPPESYTVLPIIEEDYSLLPDHLPQICGYEAKWEPHSPYADVRSIKAQITESQEAFLSSASISLFERLGCRDYARFDWRMDDAGRPHLLEVNPNPGWCWDGHLAKMASIRGWSYTDMVDAILEEAFKRIEPDRNANP